jgi:hypothetical protein
LLSELSASDRVAQWSCQRSCDWLQQAGLSFNAKKFHEYDIGGDVLVGLTLEELTTMKFAPSRIQTLLDAVATLLADVSITENEGLFWLFVVALTLSVPALVTMKDLERPIADVLKDKAMYSQPLMAKLADVEVDDLLGLCDLTVFIFCLLLHRLNRTTNSMVLLSFLVWNA